jgi:hypothetical protein
MLSKFESKEDLLVSIQLLFEKMNTGYLDEQEMNELVSATQSLYERSLLIRFKAYESKVYQSELVLVTDVCLPKSIELIEKHDDIDQEKPVFDMNFALFSDDTNQASLFSIPSEVPAISSNEDDSKDEKELITSSTISTTSTLPISDLVIGEDDFLINELIIPMKEDALPEVIPYGGIQTAISPSIFDAIVAEEEILNAPWKSQLTKLNGSFGLNEKLQLIQELFQGSADNYNQAVLALDAVLNFTEAKLVLVEYAVMYDWDLDAVVVKEFVQKVARRHA